MSTEKKRSQLELDELRRLKWLLGGALALIALASLLYLDIDARVLMIAGGGLVVTALVKPEWPERVPMFAHKLAFPAIVAFAAYDFYAHGEPLPSLVRLDVLLLVYRACGYRKRRDDLQLIVLGLLLVVMAGVITSAPVFAVQIIAYVAVALMLLFVVTLVDTQEGGGVAARVVTGGAPSWTRGGWPVFFRRLRQTCDWRVLALSGALFAGFVVLSGVLFMTIPRFQLESSLFLDRLITKKSYTGFSDTLKFGDVTDIQQDNSVVLRVEVSDRNQVPAALYWRMVVLDEYREGAFQLSAALKASAFRREETLARIIGSERPRPRASGGATQWTFYLEAGVGRYLPLTGGFHRLLFTEPQTFRSSSALRLVLLSREPVAMKAYRVLDMRTGPELSAVDGEATATEPLGLGVGENDQAVLEKIVQEITGGRALAPEEFSRTAMCWLAERHKYSLKSVVASGAGDVLVRWLVSSEPGHCELFAGSFALLARAAGHPARVVAGFLGGAWNEDYLIVRNSDAHAWCEVANGRGGWFRVDPTNEGPRLLAGEAAGGLMASNVRLGVGGWAARFDRLKLLWYRRIVNFDHADQQALMRTIKDKAEGSGRQLSEWAAQAVRQLRQWLVRPWDVKRLGALAAGIVVAGFIGFVFWRYGRIGWMWWRGRRGRGLDPVRREAGYWLRRLAREPEVQGHIVRQQLERLRYGSPETWPRAEPVFRLARQACRGIRLKSEAVDEP